VSTLTYQKHSTRFTVHHSAHPQLHLSFTPGLQPTRVTNPNAVVSLLPLGLHSPTIAWTVFRGESKKDEVVGERIGVSEMEELVPE